MQTALKSYSRKVTEEEHISENCGRDHREKVKVSSYNLLSVTVSTVVIQIKI